MNGQFVTRSTTAAVQCAMQHRVRECTACLDSRLSPALSEFDSSRWPIFKWESLLWHTVSGRHAADQEFAFPTHRLASHTKCTAHVVE
jgi:hypothetical protein